MKTHSKLHDRRPTDPPPPPPPPCRAADKLYTQLTFASLLDIKFLVLARIAAAILGMIIEKMLCKQP